MSKEELKFFRYIGERVRRYDTLFKIFTERLVEDYEGRLSIILFGSRARGDNRLSSDFDVLIIVEGGKLEEHYMRIMKCKPPELPADILIILPQDLSNLVIKQMLADSKIIYNGLNIDLIGIKSRSG
ncbi:MAG: nucleotidyltransferase domain-containing protein [Candidatus Njordarchaeia archaeon]